MYEHSTNRSVNLDGTHVTWACRCGISVTGRLEDEYVSWEQREGTVERTFLDHLIAP